MRWRASDGKSGEAMRARVEEREHSVCVQTCSHAGQQVSWCQRSGECLAVRYSAIAVEETGCSALGGEGQGAPVELMFAVRGCWAGLALFEGAGSAISLMHALLSRRVHQQDHISRKSRADGVKPCSARAE